MKKQLRNIIISLCVVLVLIVGVVVANIVIKKNGDSSSSSTSSSEGISVVKLNKDDITELNVKTTDNEYTIKKSGEDYVIDGIDTSILSQDSLTTPVQTFSDFEALKLIEENASDLSQYSLDEPTRTITGKTADKTVTLLVGKETPLKDGFYACLKGETKVYKINESIITGFDKTKLDFINLSLYSVDSSKTDAVTLLEFGGSARKTPIVLEKRAVSTTTSTDTSSSTDAAYFLKEPAEYSTNSENANSVVTSISSFAAGGVISLDVSDANLAKYGLDNPSYTFAVTNNGKKTTFKFGKAYKENDTQFIPVMLEGRKCIYKISDSDDAFYKYEVKDLATSLLYTEYIDNVKQITVTDNGTAYTVNISGTGDNLVADYNGTKLKVDNMREFYKSIVGIGVEGQTTDNVSGAAYATVNIKFRDASKKDVTMKFIKMDSRRSYWSYNGRVDFYVLSSEVDQMLSITKDFVAGKTVTYN